MGAPAEVLQEIFTVIEGGNDLGEAAKIIQFPSDNGQNVYNAVQVTQKGTNGTGMNYWVVAFTTGVGVAARAVSAGAIMLTTSVPAFAAALAPAMGLTVGYISYNLAPTFWDKLAERLVAAGETVGGKVVAFMNENGIMTYSPGAIEVLKNALLEEGIFDKVDLPDYATEGTIKITKKMRGDELFSYLIGCCGYTVVITPEANAMINSALLAMKDKLCAGLMTTHYDSSFPPGSGGMIQFFNNVDTITLGDVIPRDYWSLSIRMGYSKPTNTATIISASLNRNTLISSLSHSFVGERESEGSIYVSGINGEYIGKGLQSNARVPDERTIEETYQDWIPWEFPIIDPGAGEQQLPARLPIEYPDNLPDNETENYQDDAQNPDPAKETDPDKVTKTIQDPDKQPKPITGTPEPITPPDPDPQEDDEESIENPTGGDDTGEDPVDPDPEIPPSPIIPVPPLPYTVDSNKLFTVYNPSSSQLDALGGYLWDNDLIDILRKIWQNPLDGIISLSQVYATPVTGSNHNIILGYLDSGVSAPVVTQQFVTIDCGSVTLPELNENCLDYVPYTQIQIYLPFVGIVELDANEFMSGTVSVKYKVDVYTGSCLAEVKCTRSRDLANSAILYTFTGNCSQQLPLTSGDAKGLFTSLLAGAGLVAGIASGGATAASFGSGMSALMSREMLHVGHSGNLSANAGIMGQKKPYLIISRERPYNANNYNKFYGYPANKAIAPGNHNGFVRLKAGRLRSKATEEEKKEIMELMMKGVIM